VFDELHGIENSHELETRQLSDDNGCIDLGALSVPQLAEISLFRHALAVR
jgi:hypothetical protein